MAEETMPGGRNRAAVDWTEGMPVGHHGSLTPMGEVEQVGKMAGGLIRLTGWRRTAARLIVIAVLLLPVLGIVLGSVFGSQ